ncbi:hypothetical protein BDC45DRAFT_537498 [Circinella umbellata]|nr:hypothetical protein BDC45DRAFT_537498 [Circinella umbellata]
MILLIYVVIQSRVAVRIVNYFTQAKDNEQYYRQQVARVNKLCESLRAKVTELETDLEKKTTQPPPFLSTHSVFSMSLSPMSTTLDKPKTTLPQTSLTLSSQPTSSKSPPAQSHQKQPTINHEATPLSANRKNITTNLTVTTPSKPRERIKQARPAPTTSINPTTHKKLRQVIDSNPASINNICVTNTTEARNSTTSTATQPFTLIGKIASFYNSQGWSNQADYDHIMSGSRQL